MLLITSFFFYCMSEYLCSAFQWCRLAKGRLASMVPVRKFPHLTFQVNISRPSHTLHDVLNILSSTASKFFKRLVPWTTCLITHSFIIDWWLKADWQLIPLNWFWKQPTSEERGPLFLFLKSSPPLQNLDENPRDDLHICSKHEVQHAACWTTG